MNGARGHIYVCHVRIIYGTMGWLRSVRSKKRYVSFAEYCLFYRALLQKRPIIWSILLTKATPCQFTLHLTCGMTHLYVKDTFICDRHIHMCEAHSNETEDLFYMNGARGRDFFVGVSYTHHMWHDESTLHRRMGGMTYSYVRDTSIYARRIQMRQRTSLYTCIDGSWLHVWYVWHDVCVICVAWLIRDCMCMCDMCGVTHMRYTFLICEKHIYTWEMISLYACIDGS